MSNIEYKPIRDDHHKLFARYMQYAFRPVDGDISNNYENKRQPEGNKRGLYDEAMDQPVSVCRHYWLRAKIRQKSHPVAGLTSVIAPPEHRNNGYIPRLISESLQEYKERNRHYALLWPFKYKFYKSFGWENAGDRRIYTGSIDYLSFAKERFENVGYYKKIEPKDLDKLNDIYEQHSSEHSLVIDRNAEWWRHRVCRTRGTGGIRDARPFVYAWYRGNKLRAYVIYTFEQGENELNHRAGTLNVHEIRYDSVKSLLAILSFCYNHSSQADKFKFTVPNDTVLDDLLTEPDNIECKLLTGPMVRLVDVTQSLSNLAYPDINKNITIEVTDDFADWNNDKFTLEIENGHPECYCDPNKSKVDVRIDIGALSQLTVGYRSAVELIKSDRMVLDSELSVSEISTIFPKKTIYLNHRF